MARAKTDESQWDFCHFEIIAFIFFLRILGPAWSYFPNFSAMIELFAAKCYKKLEKI